MPAHTVFSCVSMQGFINDCEGGAIFYLICYVTDPHFSIYLLLLLSLQRRSWLYTSAIVGSKVLTAVIMECSVFWDITLCFPLAFTPGFLLGPEDGGDMFLRNVGWLSESYTALYSIRILTLFKGFCIQIPVNGGLSGLVVQNSVH
jgi:hypothetical protein